MTGTVGVDFGGTSIKLGLVEGGRILRSSQVTTDATDGPVRILDRIAEAALALDPAPREIGMAIPGEVDAEGVCFRLPNVPGFEGIHIARELSRRAVGARVVVENDGTAAALGESLHGHGRTHPSFLMVTLGTGVGGGLVIGRRVVRGAHGFAAEIGHVTIDGSSAARACVCGQRGCLEAYAGTRALLDAFREAGGAASTIREVADSARSGEAAGLAAFGVLSDSLAVALSSLSNVLDLDAYVFTGGISRSFDLIEPRLREGLRRRAYAAPLGEVPLLVSELGDQAGLVGAAALPSHRQNELAEALPSAE